MNDTPEVKAPSAARTQEKIINKNLRTVVKRGLFPLLGTLIIYKLLTMFIFLPAITGFWALILRISPVHYITNDTLFSVLKIPYVPLAIIIIGILAAFWAMFEYSIIIIGLDHAFHAEKITLKRLCVLAFKEMEHALKPRNLPILIYAAVLIPFANIFVSSNYISQLVVPEYIMEVIRKNGIYNALYILLFAGCAILSFIAIFIFHIFILDKETFVGAWKKSYAYVKKNPIRTIWIFIKKNVLVVIKYFFISAAVAFITMLALVFIAIDHGEIARSIGNAVSIVELPVLGYLVGCIMTICQFAIISAIFYERRDQVPTPSPEDKGAFKIGSGAFVAFTVAGASLLTFSLGYALYLLPSDINLFGNDETTISYHRGYCTAAPENTIPAFEAAIADGCEVIELDVQLTSDGVVVVTHDPTLKRVAGVDKKVSELTFAELEEIDVGSFFSSKFAGTHVPTLEDVLKLCKDKTDLNIEIKQDGTQPELEAKTVELIKQYDFIDHCTVTSLDYESLAKVKELEPSIKTGYILAIGVGSYYDLPAADFFSVEASFITSGMVSQIHLRGKTVSAWTINREDDAERLLSLGVDDLITEDPAMVRNAITENVGLGDNIIDWLTIPASKPREDKDTDTTVDLNSAMLQES